MEQPDATPSLEGWNVVPASDADWFAWGDGGNARGRIVGSAGHLTIFRVEADASYIGSAHDHADARASCSSAARCATRAGCSERATGGWHRPEPATTISRP